MPVVTGPDGQLKTVRNLGWLLRHAQEVTTIEITEAEGGQASMTAYLDGNRTYTVAWESFDLARAWVQRPRFAGVLCWVRSIDRELRAYYYI